MIEINKVYQGDSAILMKEMSDNFIDLTVTSPPYDNLRDYEGYSFDFETVAKELYRITSEGGVVVWVVGDSVINGSETGTSFRQALFFMKIGFNLHDTMIYHKNGLKFPDTVRYYQCFEYMFVFSKGKPKTINLLMDRRNRYVGQKIARNSSDRGADGKLISNSASKLHPDKVIQEIGIRFNIWSYLTGGADKKEDYVSEHPAYFPQDLVKDHILSWSNEKDLIFDPFAGSGTTLKMAKLMNRNYLGFEIAEEYVRIINKRLEQETILGFFPE